MHTHIAVKPWYTEPWPWILMAGPALVIAACAITVWLALVSNDGLVADDYYKQGLAVNQVLSRDAAASALAYSARVTVNTENRHATIRMNREPASTQLTLRAVHSTRPGMDIELPLIARGGGAFETAFPPLAAGRWRIVLGDRERTWRLTGELRLPGARHAELTPH